MSIRLNSDDFRERLFNSLPNLYKNIDKDNKDALYRYLCALVDGGFSYIIQENNGLLDLNDPDNTLSEVLPILYEQYGFEMFNGIPEYYSRKLLPHLCQCYKRKGAEAVVDYLVSFVANTSAYLEKTPTFDEDYTMFLKIIMDDIDRAKVPDFEQMRKIIKEFIPFFIGISVIYTYIYVDEFILNINDSDRMDIKEDKSESGVLNNKYASRISYIPIIFDPERVPNTLLNDDFILNKTMELLNEVDWYSDIFIPIPVSDGCEILIRDENIENTLRIGANTDLIRKRIEESNSDVFYSDLLDNTNIDVEGESHIKLISKSTDDGIEIDGNVDKSYSLILNTYNSTLNESKVLIPNSDIIRINGTVVEEIFDTRYGYIKSS